MPQSLFAHFGEPSVPDAQESWSRRIGASVELGALHWTAESTYDCSRRQSPGACIVRIDLSGDSQHLDADLAAAASMAVDRVYVDDVDLVAVSNLASGPAGQPALFCATMGASPSGTGNDTGTGRVKPVQRIIVVSAVSRRDPVEALVNIGRALWQHDLAGFDAPRLPHREIGVGTTGRFLDDIALLRATRRLAATLRSTGVGAENDSRVEWNIVLHSDSAIESNDRALIAATVTAFSARLGSADMVSFRPPSAAGSATEAISRFAAMQHVVARESGVRADTDYAAGSYYLENLTHQMLSQALRLLKKEGQQIVLPIASGDLKEPIASSVENAPPEHLRYVVGAGTPPFIRGPYASMYNGRTWTIRQYAGFSTAEESNAFYRRNLEAGQRGLSVAFDLPTHRGYDSDHPRVVGDVGKAGVAIDTVEDMKVLFDGIPLDSMSVSMTMNGAVLPILAFYIVAASEQGVSTEQLAGTIQNDILKEFMVRNTYIYPPAASMRIVRDIMQFCAQNMPRYNPISVSGYHMQEAGASAGIELGYTLANGLEYVRAGLASGMSIDDFAPRISFFFGIGMDFAIEVAKLRAARLLWASLIKSFEPQDEKSMALRTHCQTSGWSLTAQDSFNNVARTTIEALAAVSGHTQSLHTNALDEAVALPTDRTAAIARETQLILQSDESLIHAIDAWGGSSAVESLTADLVTEARAIIEETERAGGMTRAIELGLPKRRIEESAARRQAAIDTGAEVVVGVNTLQTQLSGFAEILVVDNAAVREAQVDRIRSVKDARSNAEVQTQLERLKAAARSGDENLLVACIGAARSRATLGEISYALESVFGRYDNNPGMVTGVYKLEAEGDNRFMMAGQRADAFAARVGRRPRILIAKLGQDGHDRGARVVASAFADVGFDVDIGPLFQTPEEAAQQAVDNDVHVLGISSLAGAHRTLVPAARAALEAHGRPDIKIAVGGVIPEQDYAALRQAGVAAIFGPGTVIAVAALEILDLLDGESA